MDNPFEIIMHRLDSIEQFLLHQKQHSAPTSNILIDEKSCTVEEIAEHLKCAISTVLRYRRNGVFPSYKAGRTIYFKKSEIDAALTTAQKMPGRNINKNLNNRA